MIFLRFSLEAENFWTKMSPCKEATRMLPCLRRIKIVYLVVVDGETVLFFLLLRRSFSADKESNAQGLHPAHPTGRSLTFESQKTWARGGG